MGRITIKSTKIDTTSKKWSFGEDEYNLTVGGKSIGYWWCSRVLQPQYGGEFIANEHGKELLGKETYAGGDLYRVINILETRLNK